MRRALLVLAVLVLLAAGAAGQSVNPATLRPENLRFRVVANEPLSGGNTIVPGTQVWIVRDMRAGHCFTLFFIGTSSAVTGPAACPEK